MLLLDFLVLCYRDILVYGLVEYMDYDIGGLGDWYKVDGRELGRRDMDFRIGVGKLGCFWKMNGNVVR